MSEAIRWSEEVAPGLFWILTYGGAYQSLNFSYPWIFKAENDAAAIAIERVALDRRPYTPKPAPSES